jgi:DNA-binding response OmpR family regulator
MLEHAYAVPVGRPAVLFVDSEPSVNSLAPALRSSFTVTAHSDLDAARGALTQIHPTLLILDAELAGATAAALCRDAKAATPAPAILVTTDDVRTVPALLAAGCDGVLLKPFPPHLLYIRIQRMLHRPAVDVPAQVCPHCGHPGATWFEFASHRRAWYACLACNEVWLTKLVR